MARKRKASEMSSDDAPVSSWTHPPWRGAGNYFSNSVSTAATSTDEDSLRDYSEDSRSDSTYVSDDDHAGGEHPNEEGEIADILAFLKIESEELAAQDVKPPSPADQSPAAEVADQSVAAAAPAPEMAVPTSESALCLGCRREPALVRLVLVKHDCLCLPCRSNPSGGPHCEYCGGPRR